LLERALRRGVSPFYFRDSMIGTIRSWSDITGYGFIRSHEDGVPDTFVHVSKLHEAGIITPTVGMRLEYEIAQRPTGKFAATKIHLVDE
jgi:cold shock CspA family protein